jgi:hypothetical protein
VLNSVFIYCSRNMWCEIIARMNLFSESVEWREIPGHPNYAVSADGRIARIKNGKQNKRCPALVGTFRTRAGCVRVALNDGGGKYCQVNVARLVCLAFHGPAPSPKHRAYNLNRDKTDNRAANVVWDVKYAPNYNVGAQHGRAKLTEDQVRAIRVDGRCRAVVAAEYGVSVHTVAAIRQKSNWKHVV